MPPKAEVGIAGKRPLIGFEQGRAGGDAAGVGMLDDGAGRRLFRQELGDELEGRVRVVDIVVGKLLALQQVSPSRRPDAFRR